MLPKCPTQYHFKCKFVLSSVLPTFLFERKIWLVIGWKYYFSTFCNVQKICIFFIFLGLFNNNNPIIIFLFLLYADLFVYWSLNTYIQKYLSLTKDKVCLDCRWWLWPFWLLWQTIQKSGFNCLELDLDF